MAKSRVQVIGAEKVRSRLIHYSKQKQAEIRQVIQISALKIDAGAKRRAPVDTGRLRSSIRATYMNKRLTAEIGPRANYAAFVEYGTSAHFPPPHALDGWARRHGILEGGFVVARAISRRGTRAQPFLFPAFEQERPKFLRKMKAVLKRR